MFKGERSSMDGRIRLMQLRIQLQVNRQAQFVIPRYLSKALEYFCITNVKREL